MWTIRNQLVHGTEGGISLLEQDRVNTLISLMFQELIPQVEDRARVVFDQSEAVVNFLGINMAPAPITNGHWLRNPGTTAQLC